MCFMAYCMSMLSVLIKNTLKNKIILPAVDCQVFVDLLNKPQGPELHQEAQPKSNLTFISLEHSADGSTTSLWEAAVHCQRSRSGQRELDTAGQTPASSLHSDCVASDTSVWAPGWFGGVRDCRCYIHLFTEDILIVTLCNVLLGPCC